MTEPEMLETTPVHECLNCDSLHDLKITQPLSFEQVDTDGQTSRTNFNLLIHTFENIAH